MIGKGTLSGRLFTEVMLCATFVAVVAAVPLSGAPQQDIGSFDIEKVRQAVGNGDTGLAGAPQAPAEREMATAVVLRITAYLGVVILLILGAAWFVRKGGFRPVRAGTPGAMDIVETLPIGQNRTLVMIRVMDEIYLVSQTANSVTLLDKIGGQKALDVIASSRGAVGGAILPFRDAFNNFMGKIKKPS
jgi:flagellar biosynthetic protein FliO